MTSEICVFVVFISMLEWRGTQGPTLSHNLSTTKAQIREAYILQIYLHKQFPQVVQMGKVTSIVANLLLIIWFLMSL